MFHSILSPQLRTTDLFCIFSISAHLLNNFNLNGENLTTQAILHNQIHNVAATPHMKKLILPLQEKGIYSSGTFKSIGTDEYNSNTFGGFQNRRIFFYACQFVLITDEDIGHPG
jgi:hypothetical protein